MKTNTHNKPDIMKQASKKRKNWIYNTFIFSLLFLFGLSNSCLNISEYPGYKKSKKGFYYKLLTIGEDEIKPVDGDFVTVDLKYKTFDDSVFFKGRRKFQLSSAFSEGSVEDCIKMLSIGEKANFIIKTELFFVNTIKSEVPSFLASDDKMKVEISMLEIQSEKDYKLSKNSFLKWIEDFGAYEKEILGQFIRQEKLEITPTPSGLYYLQLKKGNGKKIAKGDTIVINYEGKFLNGKFFDSTIKRKEPFQFVFGSQWQVVTGLEEGIAMMEEKEKAIIILPSELAFGETGSSTGIIPPFTSLIFEVEIINVKKGS